MTDISKDKRQSKKAQLLGAAALVAMYLDKNNIEVKGDQSIVRRIDPTMHIEEKLKLLPINQEVMVDEIILMAEGLDIDLPKGKATRLLASQIRAAAAEARSSILMSLYNDALTPDEQTQAEAHFKALAQVFDMGKSLCVTAIKQFMWSVKRKQLHMTIDNPQMLVIMNRVQGSGKTRFVSRFLAPLKELATDPVPISAITDQFGYELMNYPVVNMDDAGASVQTKVSAMKAIITNSNFQARGMRKSRQDRREQRATFIATTNEDITYLIPDSSGHRRFVVLPLKNGAVEKGGSADIWPIINDLDFELMWRSVPHQAEEPIKAVLKELYEYQSAYMLPGPVEQWVKAFDPTSEEVLNIKGPNGIKAQQLYELFKKETGAEITIKEFGTKMHRYIGPQPDSLFVDKKRSGPAILYVLNKPQRASIAEMPS